MRQLHLWIGAWGAIAAILFGVSGFMQNHRAVLKLPQGDSTEVSKIELAVPESARVSREALRVWLRDQQHIDVENQRVPPGRGGESRGAESPVVESRDGAARAGGTQGGESPGGASRSGDPRGGGSRRGEAGGQPGEGSRGADARGSTTGGPRVVQQAKQDHWNFTGGNARLVTQVEYVAGAPTATVRTNVQSPLAILERLHKGVGGGVAWILLGDSFALAMIALGISGLVLWSRGRSLRQMTFSIVGVALLVLLVIGGSAII
jgi:hypothetical protein